MMNRYTQPTKQFWLETGSKTTDVEFSKEEIQIANTFQCSTFLAIKEIQIKITSRLHFTLAKWLS